MVVPPMTACDGTACKAKGSAVRGVDELGNVYEPRAARHTRATIDAFLDALIGAASRTG